MPATGADGEAGGLESQGAADPQASAQLPAVGALSTFHQWQENLKGIPYVQKSTEALSLSL